MIIYLVVALVAGFLVKIVDWLDDERKSKHPVKYFFAILYGLLVGYIIGAAPFSGIFIAALIAQVFARKVDTTAHELGFLALFTVLILPAALLAFRWALRRARVEGSLTQF